MKEQSISLTTAKLAKNKKFYFDTGGKFENRESIIYTPGITEKEYFASPLYNSNNHEVFVIVPQSILQKWLRENHKIHIIVEPFPTAEGFFPSSWKWNFGWRVMQFPNPS